MTDGDRPAASDDLKLLLPYFAPYFLWVGISYADKIDPRAMYVVYPLKTILVAIVLICLRKSFPELRWKCSAHGVWVGLVAFALWLVPYWKLLPGWPEPEETTRFNPLQFRDNLLAMWGLTLFRVGGATLVIPFVEELLFRSCIARMVIDQDFKKVPIGVYSAASLGITTAAFMVGHRQWEWTGTILVGVLYYGLVVWRKNILDCIVAHGVTNFALGIYVLYTHRMVLVVRVLRLDHERGSIPRSGLYPETFQNHSRTA